MTLSTRSVKKTYENVDILIAAHKSAEEIKAENIKLQPHPAASRGGEILQGKRHPDPGQSDPQVTLGVCVRLISCSRADGLSLSRGVIRAFCPKRTDPKGRVGETYGRERKRVSDDLAVDIKDVEKKLEEMKIKDLEIGGMREFKPRARSPSRSMSSASP